MAKTVDQTTAATNTTKLTGDQETDPGAGAGAGYRQTQTQYSQSQNNAQTQNNTQNNRTNGPGKTCIYCRKPGHIQDFCFNRIDRGDPCIDSQGKSYWPKVNSNEEISSSSVFFLEN